MTEPLSREERHRYSRHILLPEIGEAGQKRLRGARVLIVGAGGLGCPAALYLAAAGVGTLGLVDFDTVDRSNLQRQVLYGESSVGKPKLEEARRRLLDLNPAIDIVLHEGALSAENARSIVRGYDVVLDGTDNFTTRYLVNDACVLEGVPNVHGSIFRFEGQVSVFDGAPCYRCLYPNPPPAGLVPSCAEGGVLGVLPGVVGTLQATEAVKIVTGVGRTLAGRLLLYDALEMEFHQVALRADPKCALCGPEATLLDVSTEPFACDVPELGLQDGHGVPQLTPRELAALRAADPDLVLLDIREPGERDIARIDPSRLVPPAEVAAVVDSLPRDRQVVLYCKVGGRSARAARTLRAAGIDAVNLRGGIDAWIDEIDPDLPRY